MRKTLNHRKLKACLFGVLLLMANSLQAKETSISILPKPMRIEAVNSTVALTEERVPVYMDKEANLNSCYISTILSEAGIYPLFVNNVAKARIIVKLDKKYSVNKEAYQLVARDNKVTIAASSKEGLLYGLQTLRQLPQNVDNHLVIPGCIIMDSPKFAWRDFMLDESRHFHGMRVVKGLLDEMARLKLNTFHWHLVDDQGWRIEIKKYPKLTSIGSKRDNTDLDFSPEKWDSIYADRKMFYTQNEIREIVRYADDRGIKIVPEIEVPGHSSAAISSYPWIGSSSSREGKAIGGDLYNIIDPKVEEFLHNVLDEVIALFPSRIVHIGGDEADYTHWKNSPQIVEFMKNKNIPTYSDLQVWSMNRFSKYLASKGCRMIGWNEITGDNIRGEADKQDSQSEKLAPGTIVQFWDGDISLVNKAIAKGYDIVNSDHNFTYLDYDYGSIPLEKAYSFNPIPEGLSKKEESKIFGSGCQMWGERTPNTDRLYYQIFPRIAAYAECGWTSMENKDYADFRERFKGIEKIWKERGYLKTQLDQY